MICRQIIKLGLLVLWYILGTTLCAHSELTYSVSVPSGTCACFVIGDMTGWRPLQMFPSGTDLYTLTLPNADTMQKYKYMCGPDPWYSEIQLDMNSLRTYQITDTVIQWSNLWNSPGSRPPIASYGNVYRYLFNSNYIASRYIDVWLPANYSASTKYSVLYMNDGEMLFDAAIAPSGEEWRVDEALRMLNDKKLIENCIIVGIQSNGNKRHAEYFPDKILQKIPEPEKSKLEKLFVGDKHGDAYLKCLVNEIKPFIDSSFSTNSDQRHTYISGVSMGGLISLYAFCEYPDVFSRAACISTHWIGLFEDNAQIPNAILDYLNAKLPVPEGRKLYFDYGTEGLDVNYAKYQNRVEDLLNDKGYNSTNLLTRLFVGDSHIPKSWSRRIHIPLLFTLADAICEEVKPFGKEFKVFPNPVHSLLFIESYKISFDNTYSIYDANGSVEQVGQYSFNGIDVSQLAPGVYFLWIDMGLGKFIKY